jgi:hypothetical protein
MRQTLYCSFTDPVNAEKAIGALLDHGLRHVDVSAVANENFKWTAAHEPLGEPNIESAAKHWISTTTAADASEGAVKGAGIGLGVGVIAGAVAMAAAPGIGAILGIGLLSQAICVAAAGTAAGAVAGTVAGFLVDQGVEGHVAEKYNDTVRGGGAIVAVTLPSGAIDLSAGHALLEKYGAAHITNY